MPEDDSNRILQEEIARELLAALPQDEWLDKHRDRIISICGYNGLDAPLVVQMIKIMESKNEAS